MIYKYQNVNDRTEKQGIIDILKESAKSVKSANAKIYMAKLAKLTNFRLEVMTFPKISRQFFDYFPKLVDTLPNFVDTFLKKQTIILNQLTVPIATMQKN